MEFKKSMLILIMAIFLVSLAGVCASDANDTAMASEDNFEIDYTTDDAIGAGEDTVLASSEENEILSAGGRSFARLNDAINGNSESEINLTSDYIYMSSDEGFEGGIVINRDLTINGNGHIINGGGEACIFQVTGGNVVFYNITFTKGYTGEKGGAIHGGHAVNCIFKENSATMGGAIYGGSAVNCTFIGNTAKDVCDGGAMYGGSAVNCTFIGNTADYDGGAIAEGSAVNCTFSGNTADRYGSAMCWGYKMNCTGQDGDYYGTQDLVLHWDANNFTTIYGSAEKLPVQLMNQKDELIDFINYDAVIYKNGSKVKTYHCLSNDWISLDLAPGIYIAELIVTYPGIVKPEPKNITLTIVETDGTTFWDLINLINNNTNDTITLDRDYAFNSTVDPSFSEGIIINRKVTINGNGHTIDAKGKARVFNVQAGDVTIKNLTIKNANYNGDGGAVLFKKSGSVINCNFADNFAIEGGAVYIGDNGNVLNCNFTANQATISGAVYFTGTGDVRNCNFTNNTATNGNGGAIRMYSGSVTNCNFTNNKATGDYSYGGAVYFNNYGNVTNCNFTNNTATNGNGGAIRMSSGSVTNCNFDNNTASEIGGAIWMSSGSVENCNFINSTASEIGGAIHMNSGSVTNCNFTDNSAEYGGAIRFNGEGTVSNCNFTGNTATNGNGGAVYLNQGTGSVSNCNFTDNSATLNGGAVYFNRGTGSVSNCNFTNNKATGTNSWGGAIMFVSTGEVINCNFINNSASSGGSIYFLNKGNVTNCNFTNNHASGSGGAVFFSGNSDVTNCNFTNNHASGSGGAVYFSFIGDVRNCNFTGNTASRDGGAVSLKDGGEVIKCNFIDNIASRGSAIYVIGFNERSYILPISNSCFLNNMADAEDLSIINKDNNIIITFTGMNNLLNAIYFVGNYKFTFTNVTYWGANGITNTGNSTINPPEYNFEEAGQNITVGVVVNDEFILNEVKVTDENGMIVLDIKTGENYYIATRHDADSYYTETEKTKSTMKFYANVSSQTTTNKTVNITAKSNIYSEFMPGKLLFIVPNTDPINATYAGNGTWWAVYTFDDYGVYEVNATYTGLDNVTINNATITINKANSTLTVGDIEFDYNNSGSTTVSFDGASGVKASVVDHPDANVSVVGNTITVSDLNAGTYNLTVTTIADADHNNVTKTSTITVNKINSTLTVGDIVFDYNSTGSGSLSFTGASGVNASVVDQPNAVVNVNTDSITVSCLNAGNYTLTVTTIADANHNNVTKTANITVNKVDSTLTVGNVVLDYGKTTNVTAVTEGATGVTAKIDNDDAVVNGNTIVIPSLDVGNYTLTVTTIADANHNNVTKTANITVNKVDSTLTVGDIVFDYNSSGSTKVSYNGAIGVNASVVSHPEAVVNVKENEITVSGLNAGNYNLTVTTIADANHNNITKTSTITVNKLKTELTAAAITATYNIDKDLVITLNDTDGNALSGVNVTVDLNGVKEYTTDENGQVKVSTKGLAPQTYTANITFNGTDIYDKAAKDVNVTVKKATPKITAKAKTFKTTTKTKKYTITLKDNTGKAIKNAKVTLKVNGKTYTAKTNSKGKATFKITKLNKKGTYKATVTYKANKYYNKATKKVKITVKSTWKTVSKGSKDHSTVKKIQKALKANGYYLTYQGHYLMVDGIFESCTERSVKEFQSANGLKVTGKVDEKTAKKLKII